MQGSDVLRSIQKFAGLFAHGVRLTSVTMHPKTFALVARGLSAENIKKHPLGSVAMLGVSIYEDPEMEPGKIRAKYSDGSERLFPEEKD